MLYVAPHKEDILGGLEIEIDHGRGPPQSVAATKSLVVGQSLLIGAAIAISALPSVNDLASCTLQKMFTDLMTLRK